MKRGYSMHDGQNLWQVEGFTSLPKRLIDRDGVVHELDRALFDPRNFTDQKEQMVLWWVVRQVLRFDGSKRQVAWGKFSIKAITDATGYHHKTIWTRLARLQARNVLRYLAGKGTTERGEVALNLALDEWLPPIPQEKKPRGRHAMTVHSQLQAVPIVAP